MGTIDDIPALSETCKDEHVFLHIDAAFGGFVIPFLKELGFDVPDFDFKLDGVDSIEIDAHKMGCSVIPMGTLLIRNKHWLEEINVESPCVSTEKQTSILGTRPGAAVAAAYAVMNYLGKEGYKKIVKNCMDTTYYAAQRIKEINLELVAEPTINVLGIKFRNASEVVRELSERGWKVGKMRRIGCIRLVLMPHITKNIIDQFIPDLRKVCKKLEEI
ncbi:PLP-dependent enzyme, glutamate decarboxylase [Thermoplasmatales archaeon SCGC AB-539-N05]|nr:PLP-dependent enzyme, glutamate decarboxylase [Thermoplasmatales archaeon SCGC AB-539-N05]